MDKSQSLCLYDYLCQKIGSEEVVRVRRITTLICDIGSAGDKRITSGSRGEGLSLKSSDLDLMIIDSRLKVYESEKDIVHQDGIRPLIVDVEDTQPCFTKLRLFDPAVVSSFCKTMLLNDGLYTVFSSELCRLTILKLSAHPKLMKMHGPCLSDQNDQIDITSCLKCDQWISVAKAWVNRPRTWPSPDIISKITSCGVLFVPIGSKGSKNEHIEWRISFSVAEKIIIFSFNHTQLLCYALLKILLKEIIESHKDLKGLLCSYFIKTLLFWMIEESIQSIWRPDNIITCFMSCVQRLLYCVQYSTLLHYFIPDNNLFFSRFNITNKYKLINTLTATYNQGINFVFCTETLCDYSRVSNSISRPFDTQIRLTEEVMQHLFLSLNFAESAKASMFVLMYNLVKHSRTRLSRDIFTTRLSKAFQFNSQDPSNHLVSNNKHEYYKYKYNLSQLLVGLNTDAVSGWLFLASFFYIHNKYLVSLSLIGHVLGKSNEEIKYFQQRDPPFSQIQKYGLRRMKREKRFTVLKTLSVMETCFKHQSSIIPRELQLDVTTGPLKCAPVPFAYFLRFLCYYNLHYIPLCIHSLQQLLLTVKSKFRIQPSSYIQTHIFCGIACQMVGESKVGRHFLQTAANFDIFDTSSAKLRLLIEVAYRLICFDRNI